MRIAIVGGGIGGVACGVALAREGIEPVILEQAHELGEIGAGLQLSANAMKVLRAWGLEDAVHEVGVAALSVEFRDLATGEDLFSTPLGDSAAERYGARFHQIHRADLLDLLAAALPDGAVRLGARVTGFAQDDDGVDVELESGERVRADALVGADGLKSVVREQLLEPAAPRFSGTLGWRALLSFDEARDLGFEHRCYAYLGPGRSMVLYWLRSGTLLNAIGFVPADEVHRESWTQSGDVADMRASFAATAPEIEALVARVEGAFITGVYDRDPLPRWSVGRTTILGDAAHPLAPYLAQGACQALEDAAALAGALRETGPGGVPAALEAYERRRRPRTTKAQVVARAAERFWHERDPVQIAARNGRFRGISRIDPLTETVWSWLYDHDPVAAADATGAGRALGVATARDEVRLRRPEAQRIFERWRDALTPADHAGGWQGLRAGYARFLGEHCPAPQGTRIEAAGDDGSLRVVPPGGPGDGPVVLYLHGGGYMLGSAQAGVDLAARLAAAVGGTAVAVDYRLAPEHPFPAAVDDALAAYRGLLDAGVGAQDVVLAGDSAGGGLAVATALRARDAGLPQPRALYAMSPLADLALGSPSIDAHEGADPAVSRDLLTDMSGSYLQGHDPADPFASPVHGDLAGLAPLLVHAAAGEALADDARRLADAARAAGVATELELFDDAVHAFPLFADAPDTADALEAFGRFAAAQR